MNKIKSLLLLITLFALGACSGGDEGEPGGGNKPSAGYEQNRQFTDLLATTWKITEYEPAGKSYYTKDQTTSWLINETLYDGGTYIRGLSYKLSQQTSINWVENVAVYTRTADGTNWIFDTEANKAIFCIEELYDGGNYYVMIIRDGSNNRYRCHSVSNARLFFLHNQCNYDISVKYTQTIAGTTESPVEYTLGNVHPDNAPSHYVLIENADAIEMHISTFKGLLGTPAYQIYLTCSDLIPGFNRGTVQDADFDNVEPGEDPTRPVEFNTDMEARVKGKFFADQTVKAWFAWTPLGDTEAVTASFNSREYYNEVGTFRIRTVSGTDYLCKLDETGNYEPVISLSFSTIDPKILYFAINGSSESGGVVYPAGALLYYKNSTSYDNLKIESSVPHFGYADFMAKKGSEYSNFALMPLSTPSGEKLTVTATITPSAEGESATTSFDYKLTFTTNGSAAYRIIITDDDLTREDTPEEIYALEQLMWHDRGATAWRIDEYKPYAGAAWKPVKFARNGWLVTTHSALAERTVSFYEGTRPYSIAAHTSYRYSLKWNKEAGVLQMVNDQTGSPWFDILTPARDVLRTGDMDIRKTDGTIFRLILSKKPLIIGARLTNGGNSRDIQSAYVIEMDSYGRYLTSWYFLHDGDNAPLTLNYPEGGFFLASDETLASDEDNKFSVEIKYSNGTVSKTGLKLGNFYLIDITK